LTLLGVVWTVPASAFPPYRSTDAGTADPWVFETRLGVLRLRRDRGDSVYSSPLLRLNLGLPGAVELITELEVRPGNGGLTDAALGAKWVPVRGRWSLGTETLLLLPVPNAGGVGIESQLVATYRDRAGRLRLHPEWWRVLRRPDRAGGKGLASERARRDQERALPTRARGFREEDRRRPVEVLAGPGVIVDVGRMDIRLSVHVGLTAAAPDVVLDAWGSTAFSVK
jgi:hypothetical protein